MSRPKLSEPIRKRCCSVSPSSVVISPIRPGSRSRLAGSNSDGSTVPSQGASSAIAISNVRTEAPMRTDTLRRTRVHALGCVTTEAASTDSVSKLAASASGADEIATPCIKENLVADARVEEHVREIDQQVDHHVDEREQQDQALDRREVACQHRIDREPAEPGDRVHRF